MEVIYNNKDKIIHLKKVKDFDIHQTFTCGQCFRWQSISENTFRGVVENYVVDVMQPTATEVIIKGVDEAFFKETLWHYFDFDRDYHAVKALLSKKDNIMKEAIGHGQGIRILNQAAFETLLSFIISGNNNIPRIMKAIEALSVTYGNALTVIDGVTYYSFPTAQALKDVTIEEYRALGVGYRDQYLYHTVQAVCDEQIDLEVLATYPDVALREALLTLKGVGPKIADCVLLFGFHRLSAFPVDTWVKKIMKAYYLNEKSTNKAILEFASSHFGAYGGIAQQYLFYYSRSRKI